MKRGVKKGTRRSPEMISIETLKTGSIFFTTKKPKDVTALATTVQRKVQTEVLYCLHPNTLVCFKITKVTIN